MAETPDKKKYDPVPKPKPIKKYDPVPKPRILGIFKRPISIKPGQKVKFFCLPCNEQLFLEHKDLEAYVVQHYVSTPHQETHGSCEDCDRPKFNYYLGDLLCTYHDCECKAKPSEKRKYMCKIC